MSLPFSSILVRTLNSRDSNGRPLARAPDDELRDEDPARRRHLRRGRGEVTPQRSGLSARLRGSGPRQREPPPLLREGSGDPGVCRCAREEEGRRTREREKERESVREQRTKTERRARSREFESRTTDGINCVLASSRREARTRARDRERTLARVTREPQSSRGDFYRIGFFGLQEGRSFPPASRGFPSDQPPQSLLQRAPSLSYPATLNPSSTAVPTLK